MAESKLSANNSSSSKAASSLRTTMTTTATTVPEPLQVVDNNKEAISTAMTKRERPQAVDSSSSKTATTKNNNNNATTTVPQPMVDDDTTAASTTTATTVEPHDNSEASLVLPTENSVAHPIAAPQPTMTETPTTTTREQSTVPNSSSSSSSAPASTTNTVPPPAVSNATSLQSTTATSAATSATTTTTHQEPQSASIYNDAFSLLTENGLGRLYTTPPPCSRNDEGDIEARQQRPETPIVLQVIGIDKDKDFKLWQPVFLSDGQARMVCFFYKDLEYLFTSHILRRYGLVQVDYWTLEETGRNEEGTVSQTIHIVHATALSTNPGVTLGTPRHPLYFGDAVSSSNGSEASPVWNPTEEQSCSYCNAAPPPNQEFQVCRYCREAPYCCWDCSRYDWPRHRDACCLALYGKLLQAKQAGKKAKRLSREKNVVRALGYCKNCGATPVMDGITLTACEVCNVAKYCSAECKDSHWAKHKKDCEFAGFHQLVAAIRQGDIGLVAKLSKWDFVVNAVYPRQIPPLADNTISMCLVDHTAAYQCIYDCNTDMLELVLERKPSNLDRGFIPPVLLALRRFDNSPFSRRKVLKMLLGAGADPNPHFPIPQDGLSESTLLITFAKRGQTDMVKFLLEFGANAGAQDADGRTALEYAEQSQREPEQISEDADFDGTIACLQKFMITPQSRCSRCKASVGEQGVRCINCRETLYCSTRCLQADLSVHKKAACQKLCFPKLIDAIHNDEAEIVARLAKVDHVVNAMFPFGKNKQWSAIHHCCHNAKPEMFKALKSGGCLGLETLDEFGYSPLVSALLSNHKTMVKELLHAGADLNRVLKCRFDVSPQTKKKKKKKLKAVKVSAMFCAFRYADYETANLLFEAGFNNWSALVEDVKKCTSYSPRQLCTHNAVHGGVPPLKGKSTFHLNSETILQTVIPLCNQYIPN